jgi:hypothetical protein
MVPVRIGNNGSLTVIRKVPQISGIGRFTTPVLLQIGGSGGIRIKTVEICTKTEEI